MRGDHSWHFWNVLVAASLAACGTGEVGPGESPTVELRIYPVHALHLMPGDTTTLIAMGVDRVGDERAVSGVTWSSSHEATGPILGTGLFTARQPGSTWIHATTNTLRDSVEVRVLAAGQTPFRITLLFAADVDATWRAALQTGARRWEDVMLGALPPSTDAIPPGSCPVPPGEPMVPAVTAGETGVVIHVGQSSAFPAGTFVEAVGGPCRQRAHPFPTTIVGAVTLNRAKPSTGIAALRLQYVATHELGHALGLVGVVQGEQPPWFDLSREAYAGSMGLEGLRRTGFGPMRTIPVTGGHWPPAVTGDVMAATSDPYAVTLPTIGALRDLGYPASWSRAGPI